MRQFRLWAAVAEAPARPGVPLFQAGAAHAALLRFSRGAGLPEPLPDALGVAIKLPDAHGPSADQDLLLTSSSDRPLLRRLLLPDGLQFELRTATVLGRSRPLATRNDRRPADGRSKRDTAGSTPGAPDLGSAHPAG
jgi:hypothetical protein